MEKCTWWKMLEGRKSGGGCEHFPASECPRHQHLQSAHFCALQNLLQVTGGIPAFCSLSFSFLSWLWLKSEIREPGFSSQSGECQQVEVGRNLSLAVIRDVHSQGWGVSAGAHSSFQLHSSSCTLHPGQAQPQCLWEVLWRWPAFAMPA